MATYYRWIAKGVDLDAAKRKMLQVSASPRHCCWIFDMSEYKPSAGIQADRVLVAFVCNAAGESMINDTSKHVDFLSTEYKGDTKHPDGIIIKPNEPGAYGVGQSLLKDLNGCIKEAKLADRKELSKALGRSIPQSQIDIRMRNQKW
jgi:hypothetical protein